MSPITSLLDTSLIAAPIQPFPSRLTVLQNPAADESEFNPFAAMFNAAMDVLDDTNRMVANAQQYQLDFATGRVDDILAVQMAMDRANNAINFTSQITNRVIEAYREIMRMQI